MKKYDVAQVYKDLEYCSKKQSKLHKCIKEDFAFALGEQWKEEDKRKLEEAGVLALTINKIKQMIKVITGIERQSRSDYVAMPEGSEDALTGEIVTRLMKNIVKRSSLDKKTSELFKEGVTGGLCYMEPFIDYTYDLINGEMKFRKLNADRVFYPEGEEYDLSDRPYVIKMTYGLSKEDLLELFPDEENRINDIKGGKIDFSSFSETQELIQTRNYLSTDKQSFDDKFQDGNYDLIEYFYKNNKTVFYLGDKATGQIQETKTKEEAQQLKNDTLSKLVDQGEADPSRFVIIKKVIPEIRLKQVVGDIEFSDEVAWSYPNFKFYPIIPFFAERMTVNIDNEEMLVQGIVRSIKDLQIELNKSRTLELRHLNSTANSGWMFPKGALDQRTKEAFKRFGSSPGFVGEYDPQKTGGTLSPETFRINPAQMPTGHMALSAERAEEIKQASGVNPDLLANDSESQSGRAILLKQRQGLVMIQEALDNYAETKKLLGRFILSQLGEVYTVETAVRVLGDAFIKEHFSRPVLNQDGSIAMDEKGQMVTEVDSNELAVFINQILNDAEVGKYDISIGEGSYSETIKFMNFLTLMDMVEKGIPIPPEVIIEESSLSEGQKKKIFASIEQQRQALLAQQNVVNPA